MKRLYTKKSILGGTLSRADKNAIYFARDVHHELKKFNAMIDGVLGEDHKIWPIIRMIQSRYLAQICPEDSYRLCYEAIVRCIKCDRHRNLKYVYSSCDNAHRYHLRQERRVEGLLPEDFDAAWEEDIESIDFRFDIDDAIGRVGLDVTDADICRRRLIYNASFSEIGEAIGRNRWYVERRFLDAVARLDSLIGDYVDTSSRAAA